MWFKWAIGIVLLLACCYSLAAQEADMSVQEAELTWYRDYLFLFGGSGDVQNAVTNARTFSKMLFDAYYRVVEPGIKHELLKNGLGALWSFTITWLSSMVPQEDELAFVTGCIEVNTLYAMNVQKDWYRF